MTARAPLEIRPIGIVRSPLVEPREAARQPYAAGGVEGTVELFAGRHFEDALCDLDGFDHIWVLFHFDRVTGWRPKVLPPRSARQRRGVFATRSPHRPNPIGMSVLELVRIDGLTLHVRGLDILDGSPVLDIKPYLAYADCVPGASTGWVTPLATAPASSAAGALVVPADPEPGFAVGWAPGAREKLDWLCREQGLCFEPEVVQALSLGPQPHAYRRIKRVSDHLRLALKAWRFDFRVDGRVVTVIDVQSGHRDGASKAADAGELAAHAAFRARFPS